MRRLLCIGDLNADITITSDDRIASGSDTHGRVALAGGGSAANVAAGVVATSHDATARFVGVVGDDLIGAFLVDELAGHGVEVREVIRPATASRSIAALVDSAGDRSMVSDLSTATVLGLADVDAGWFDRADWLHLTAYSWFPTGGPDVFGALVAAATERSIPWSLDPSSAQMLEGERSPQRALDAFVGAAVIFPNEDEAARLTGHTDPQAAAEELLDVADTVAVTCGADGAVIARRGEPTLVIAAQRAAVVNTLGAGDAFAAGFLAARLAGRTDDECARSALASAAEAVARPTAR